MAPAAAQPDGGNLTTQTSPLSVPLQSPDSSQRDEANGSQPSPPSDFSTFGDASLQQHQDQPHRNLYQDFTQSHWDAVLQRPTDHTRRSTLASQGTLHQPDALYFPFPLASEVTVNDLISALPPRMASNIGIALQCNAAKPDPNLTLVERERRRRCWAGILLLHTYQAILFRDVDMSSLINDYTTMPENVNDTDILHDRILQPSTQPTQMSVMIFKISLFRLSARICKELSDVTPLTQARLVALDAEIASEQQRWASIFLVDGAPSLLDSSSYALWCALDVYAHQLYLLLHRPFSRPANQPLYRPESRQKCITSSLVLLDIHQKWMELPRLSSYRWYAYGVVGSCALHGAATLASCLLEHNDPEIDTSVERKAFDAAVLRFDKLQERGSLYVKAYPVLRQLQSMLSPDSIPGPSEAAQGFGTYFDDWIDNVQWLNPESIDWNFWDEILQLGLSEVPS
ncbi:hypothetical protein FOMG_18150 [Fusarium oxysporum f. sp. melonis 26406]|uniref:Transcription factor domain-containing protein n=2 Tax=Fusarium oxysporum TaxID=5507 RepID=W9ZA85_FUSOX|nr:hypothetical protein FOVG_15885 [Fusarium oxysporum f. sp. pisi HDV247]EXK25173.1 hypothetical protein FOMG_18150 [Fusarium oxysporum f. sp. melonis 26406]